MHFFNWKIFVVAGVLFAACNTAIGMFEKTAALPKHEWSSKNRLSFDFTATDSSAYYNIYFVMRHTESYHFNNIWINFTSIVPGQKPQTQKLNLQLAGANGWLGTAMDDIIEQRILLFNNPVKLAKGNHTFTLQQIMREDPLQNVLSAGVRVERVVQ